jgi:two-component system response regulator AtoC
LWKFTDNEQNWFALRVPSNSEKLVALAPRGKGYDEFLATNVNIKEAIATKTFREDLYYRISTFVFSIPPLRDRRDDIPVLLSRYLEHHADRLHLPARTISNELWERCLSYDWPGNVRELENFAKRYLICGEDEIAVPPASHGPKNGFQQGLTGEADSAPGDFKFHMREVRSTAEASAISLALQQTNWNRKQASKLLTISYKVSGESDRDCTDATERCFIRSKTPRFCRNEH